MRFAHHGLWRLMARLLISILILQSVSNFFPLTAVAQAVKPTPAKSPTRAKTGPAQNKKPHSLLLNLNRDNLAKEAYRIWLTYYQAQQQGKQPPLPNFNVPKSVETKEAQWAQSVWQQAQLKAQHKVALQHKHKQNNTPSTQVTNGQAPSLKLSPDNLAQEAYHIWWAYYQAREQGKEPSRPIFNVPKDVEAKEARRAYAVWQEARLKVQRERQQKQNSDLPPVVVNTPAANTQTQLAAPVSANQMKASPPAPVPATKVPLPNNQTIASPFISAYQGIGLVPFNRQPQTIADVTKAYTTALMTNSTTTGIFNPTSTPPATVTATAAPNISMVYNGDGDRVSKTVNGVTTNYLVDRNLTGYPQVLEEIQNGEVVRSYSYGLGIAPISQRQLINGEWVTSFYGYDGEGNVRFLMDANGNITDSYDYDAFGNVIYRTGNTPNTRLYKGEEYDPDLGLYYLRKRWYNPVTGRFFTQDDYEGNNDNPASLHKYLYANADPVNNSDPSGNSTIVNTLTAAAIALTIVSLPTLIADRIQAPTNDAAADEIGNLRFDAVEQEAAALNAVATSLGLAARFANIRSRQGIGASDGVKGTNPPFNPSGGKEKFQVNCGACVGAVLRSVLRRTLTTADEIENEVGAIKYGSIKNTQELLNYLTKVVEVDNARLVPKPLRLREPGSYVLVYENVPGRNIGHTIFAQVFKDGRVFIYDPQRHIKYGSDFVALEDALGTGGKSFKLVKD